MIRPNPENSLALHLTPQELEALIDMTYLARCILETDYRPDDPTDALYDQVEQKILAKAEQAGLNETVMADTEHGGLFYSKAYEQRSPIRQRIDNFEDDLFWEQLVERLAWRDASDREGGDEVFDAIDPEEREEIINPYRDRYWSVLESKGIDSVSVDGV